MPAEIVTVEGDFSTVRLPESGTPYWLEGTAAPSPDASLDWLHEREWRLPGDFQFEDGDIEYVIVDTIGDAQQVVQTFGTVRFPFTKIIVMEVYRTIQAAWRGT